MTMYLIANTCDLNPLASPSRSRPQALAFCVNDTLFSKYVFLTKT